jgi:hypothetical protein
MEFCTTLAKNDAHLPLIDELSLRVYEYIVRGSRFFSQSYITALPERRCGCGTWLDNDNGYGLFVTEINGKRIFHHGLALHKFTCHRDEVTRDEINFVKSLPKAIVTSIPSYMVICPVDGFRNRIYHEYKVEDTGKYRTDSCEAFSARKTTNHFVKPTVDVGDLVQSRPAVSTPAPIAPAFKPVKRTVNVEPAFKPVKHSAPPTSIPKIELPFKMMLGSLTEQTRESITNLIMKPNKYRAMECWFDNQKIVMNVVYLDSAFSFAYQGESGKWIHFRPVFLVVK